MCVHFYMQNGAWSTYVFGVHIATPVNCFSQLYCLCSVAAVKRVTVLTINAVIISILDVAVREIYCYQTVSLKSLY